MSETNMKHFKTAQIAGMEVSLKDLEKINSYALSKLEPADIYAFKVSMAGNEIDRDYEVFPRSTLVKLANLFVGKTVVKDHDHRSDNQIARIYSTELVENDLARMTKTGEVFTQLVAKCYMVKTSRNADLIAEIQAGIRKEVSLGCRVDKAICSICGTDNVKTYCEHFPGKRYNNNQLCYFSLENASDAYELSFVAVPAQAHAGTVKFYGKKPCREEEIMARKKALADAREVLRAGGITANGDNEMESDSRLTVNRDERAEVRKSAPNLPNSEQTSRQNEPKDAEIAPNDAENAPNDEPKTAPETEGGGSSQVDKGEDISAKEMLKQLHEIAQQLLVFQKSFMKDKEAEQSAPASEATQDSEQTNESPQPESSEDKDASQTEGNPSDDQEDEQSRLTVNRAGDQEEAEESEENAADQKGASSEGKSDEGEDPDETEHAMEEEKEAAKNKTAQARLRALDLALSLRKKN